jgi:7,8-dihydropterin-6-yl-methyl-4-(beta-D-ribofuranosyl)aminobenzene 5'-phosphate synthase
LAPYSKQHENLELEDAMRITALIENDLAAGRDDLTAEFGLSFHVDTGAHQVLFDTGTSGTFADNAEALGIDLTDVDVAVVSHHHFDHGGGLRRFLEVNDRATIYLRGSELAELYFKAFFVVKKPIGLDHSLFDAHSDRFEFVTESTEVVPGVFLLTEIGSSHARPKGNRRLFAERDGRLVPDSFDHELMMVIRDQDGLVVFSGCSHHGILNMIDAAVAHFPEQPIKAILGGFHLIGLPFFNSMAASRREVEDIGRLILEHSPGIVYSSHCTGQKAFSVLKGVMGDTLESIHTGTSVEL